MKSLRFMGNSVIEVVNVPKPELKPDQVLLKVKISALCGSEMGSFYSPNASAGNGGHEFAGEVVDTNGNDCLLAKGDRVGVHVVVGCGTCVFCKTGRETFCKNLGFCGNAHAEYVAVPARACLKLPDNIDWETGVLIAGDAMGVSYHMTQRVGLQAADTVAVIGLGPIGLGMVAMWSFLGARVIGVDMSEYRRNLAVKLGAWKSVEAGKKNTVDKLRKLTGGEGPDTCLECTGKPSAVELAFEAVGNGGKIGLVGEQGQACFNPSRDLIHKEVNVYGGWYFRHHEFPGMVELCNRGLKAKKVITHRFPLEEAQKGYDLMAKQACGKVVFVQY